MGKKAAYLSIDLKTEEALALQRAVADAREACLKAHGEYQRVLEIAKHSELDADGRASLQRVGRAYAEALTHHTKVTMDWLVYVDKILRTPQSKGKGVGH